MAKHLPLDDPAFPHGKNVGYQKGCRKTYPCPATPTCTETHAAVQADYWRRRRDTGDHLTGTGRIARNVYARYLETREVASVAQIADFLGVRRDTVTERAKSLLRNGVRTRSNGAAELDRAWAWFVKGSDLTAIEKHGTTHAYNRYYCRCESCSEAMMTSRKRWEAGITVPEYRMHVDPRVSTHVRDLIAAAGSIGQLATITGYHHEGLTRIAKDPQRPVRADVRARLMSFDARMITQALSPSHNQDSARTLLLVGQMRALGYPVWWQNEKAGLPKGRRPYTKGRAVHVAAARAIADLHKRVGDRHADAERDGIEQRIIKRTKTLARRDGYYPPAYYDDDGTLDYRSIPDHPWRSLDARAERAVETAYLLATDRYSHAKVGKETGQSDKTVQRLSAMLGLVYGEGLGALDRAACADVLRRIRDAWTDFEEGSISAVTAALTIGCLRRPNKSHPDVQAWARAHSTPDTSDNDTEEVAA